MALAAVLLLVAVSVLVVWLSSRDCFIFLHQIVRNSAEVTRPWREYRREGNALCLLRVALGFAVTALVLAPIAICWPDTIAPLLLTGEWDAAYLAPLVIGGVAVATTLVAHGVLAWFVDAVAVPIQYRRRCGPLQALQLGVALALARPGAMLGYALSYLLTSVVVLLVLMVVIVVTCCLAGCLMSIPYLGTVFMLPLLVFIRSLQLIVLAQFGQEHDVWVGCAERPTPQP